jgi:sugar lactone lactonase YvrE
MTSVVTIESFRRGLWEVDVAADWRLTSASQPRGLSSANGVRFGPDGALYVVSAFGSEIARIDCDSGAFEIISPQGDGIESPDDLAFDSRGVMYVSECMNARVSALDQRRETRVVADGLPGANGITIFEDRIFITECRPSGRLLEVFRNGRRPVVLADGLGLPNGMCVGPDRKIYFVQVYAGEIMRMPLDGGDLEKFVDGLEVPSSVRLGPDGRIWVSQGHTGKVTKIDPVSRQMETVARARPGIDNLDISSDGRLFLSYYIDGQVVEVVGQTEVRELVPAGLLAPYGLAVLDDVLHIADGMKTATLASGGQVEPAAKYTDDGFPGYIIGMGPADSRLCVTTTGGRVAVFDPAALQTEIVAEGFEEVMGVAVRSDGAAVVAEAGAGRIVEIERDGSWSPLATNLGRPIGVAVAGDDACFVSDEEHGTVIRISRDGSVGMALEGLAHPHGVTVSQETLYVLEAGKGRLVAVPSSGGEATVLASGLPVGNGSGGVRESLGGLPELVPGPISPFAGLAADSAGRVYISGDALGVVLVLERVS